MNKFVVNIIRYSIFLVITLLLGGCSSQRSFILTDGSIAKGFSLVYGDISIEAPVSGLLSRGTINILNVKNQKIVLEQPVQGIGGPFYWFLKPGRYAISDMKVEETGLIFKSVSSCRIYAEFSVDSDQTVVYVGSLRLKKPLPSPAVIDDYDSATRAFRNRFPSVNTAPIKQLMQLEERR